VPHLPRLPKVELVVLGDRSSEPQGFLTLKRFDCEVRVDDRPPSARFRYDLIDRRALDAAVMAVHHLGPDGQPRVWLRSAIRPPVALRSLPPQGSGALWELPAGLIEPGEDPAAAAARELEEELGFAVAAVELAPLGNWSFPAPGFVGEAHWFFHARVDPEARKDPGGDGSPLEEAAAIIHVPLAEALLACEAGEIRDAKTELALRRLADVLGGRGSPR
jgi:ADP-ribose pyrophosphatase